MFRIQIFHPESGLYLQTNHESEGLEELKALLDGDAFTGMRFRIVDDAGTVHYGPVHRERKTAPNIEDIARSLGVPVLPASDLFRRRPDSDE